MDGTTSSNQHAASTSGTALLDAKLEVIKVPVSDVDRAKSFYANLGWRLDADFVGENWRGVQMTPPGSPCSIHFGKGVTTAVPGSLQGMMLVVDDVEAARAQLVELGANVSEVYHYAGFGGPRVTGVHPDRRTYGSFADFSDPDGNGWVLQEVKMRLPGRGLGLDVATMTTLLRETEEHHGEYEAIAPMHHWSDWYAAYMVARVRGRTSEDAVKVAGLHMESVLR